jgi:hypothetical protein
MDDICDESPHGGFNECIIADRLFTSTTVHTICKCKPDPPLSLQRIQAGIHEFIRASRRHHFQQADSEQTFHMALQHAYFLNPDFLNPQPVTPNYA